MTDKTEQTLRDGIAELVRSKPDLGSVDLDEVVRSGRLRGPSRAPVTRWLAVAAVFVVLASLGAGLWFGPLHPGPPVTTAEPANPAASLAGVTWRLTHLKGDAVLFDAQGRVPYLRFEDKAVVVASDTCNGITGTYRLDGKRLSLEGLMVTEAFCSDQKGVLDQRHNYATLLGRVARFDVGGPTLTLFDSAGTPVLTFRAADASPAPVSDVQIRVRNDSAATLEDVRASFPSGTVVNYGTIAAGKSSAYRQVGKAYRYAAVRATFAGKEIRYDPTDYVGETLLPPGRYTYVLDPGRAILDLRLEVDQ